MQQLSYEGAYPGSPCFVGCYKAFVLQAFYKMSDPRPVSCLLRSGTKRCSGEEIVFFFHQTSPPPFSHQPCEKARTRRLPSSSSRPIPGYVLSNPWEKTFHHFFCSCPSTRLLLSISWSISDSCYISAERRQRFILARFVPI